MNIEDKIKKALELIQEQSLKKFGVNRMLYKNYGDKLEVIFLVSKENASGLISFLNSLSYLIEKELKNITIESNFYVDGEKKDIEHVIEIESLQEVSL